jgi:hypothetical protein
MALGGVAIGPSTQPAAVDLGTRCVRVDQSLDRDVRDSPGLATITTTDPNGSAAYGYTWLSQGLLRPGASEIVGLIGSGYASSVRFEAQAYTRSGNTISIRLVRSETGGTTPGAKDALRAIWVSAPIPADLPDGHYRVDVIVALAHNDDHAAALPPPATLSCEFDLPTQTELFDGAERKRLAALADEDLLKEYIAAGLKTKGLEACPRDETPSLSPIDFEAPQIVSFQLVREQILSRGGRMAPGLLELLRRELPRNAQAEPRTYPFGFSCDLIDLLLQIREPQAAATLVDVVGGAAIAPIRKHALESLQRLTYVSMTRSGNQPADSIELIGAPDEEAVRFRNADGEDDVPKQLSFQAAQFRIWLAGEGHNPANWLPAARRRARALLALDDLDQVSRGLSFLHSGYDDPHDDAPDVTLARVAQIAEKIRFEGGTAKYGDKVLPYDWASDLLFYGPKARRYLPTIIRLIDHMADEGLWSDLSQLPTVGGPEVMDYLLKRLPELEARMRAAGLKPGDTEVDRFRDKNRWETQTNVRACYFGIEQCAGRTFADASEAAAWWAANRDKTPEQWLRESLRTTADRADAGDEESRYLFAGLAPDSAELTGYPNWAPPTVGIGPRPTAPPAPIRRPWLAAYDTRLRYDPDTGTFRVSAKNRPSSRSGVGQDD